MVKIVEEKKLDASTVMITIEGDKPSELSDVAAKEMAYAARLNHGLASAGISSEGGIYPTTEDDKTTKFRKEFKLWAGL